MLDSLKASSPLPTPVRVPIARLLISWGDCVLRALALRPGQHFSIGTDPRRCDFVMPSELVACDCLTLIDHDAIDGAGQDVAATIGDRFGPTIRDPRGTGLGVRGPGPGGGGVHLGIGLGNDGAHGHGAGSGEDQGIGMPPDASPFHRRGGLRTHERRAPALSTHVGEDAIVRVLGQYHGQLASCLVASAATVSVRVAVDSAGNVVAVAADRSDSREQRCLSGVLAGVRLGPGGTVPVTVTVNVKGTTRSS